MRRITAPAGAFLAAAALALGAGCGGGPAGDGGAPAAPADDRAPASLPTEGGDPAASGDVGPAGDDALVARAGADIAVFTAPGGGQASVLPAVTEFASPRVLLVLSDQGQWLEVALPVRPNGSTGWVRRADVTLQSVDQSIVIDLAARTLTLRDGDTTVLTTPVAVGTDDSPTPTGTFYVVDKLDTGDPSGPYGRFAFGLSAHSDVLTEFAGGDGQVGIHGTNDPSSIGQAASHGCVRVPPEVAAQLATSVPLGTPVTIA